MKRSYIHFSSHTFPIGSDYLTAAIKIKSPIQVLFSLAAPRVAWKKKNGGCYLQPVFLVWNC